MADRYDPKVREPHWQKFWEEQGIYKFNPKSEKPFFSIDTPPPTVSGKMHMGHAFGNSQADFIARYKRMNGHELFFPFGTDDNGLPTQILIQKLKNVYAKEMGRKKFTELCLKTLKEELRPEYLQDWKRIAISCDWNYTYSTVDKHSQKISQWSFIDLVNKGLAYRKKSPAMVCPKCRTSIAQVELEDLERTTILNHVQVEVEGGEKVVFATTRPELMMACIAISVHPDDKRYQHLIGKTATIPVSNAKVPIIADTMTKMDFGSGVVYWCPYGDSNDIEFVAKHPELQVKHIMNPDGKLNALAGKYEGMNSEQARKAVIEDWDAVGAIIKKEQKDQVINVHERCGRPIEFVVMPQWAIKVKDEKDIWLKAGEKINWFPEFMKHRYDNWAKGLKWDWNISRQIFFGVPFPVWYCADCDHTILAKQDQLPVDPLEDKAPTDTCPKCSSTNIIPESDIINTWATSSLTPQLAINLVEDEAVRKKLYPMNFRCQGHDIISFWLFNTVVKAHHHYNQLPWNDAFINGWVLDPKGKKMSKSKGNIIPPQQMIEKYCADALRFFAGSSKLGEDVPFQEKELLSGKKIVNKFWNAAKFAAMHFEKLESTNHPGHLEKVDEWIISKLNKLVKSCTENFEKYEFSRTKIDTENFFMNVFCDYYLEIVKDRLYNPDKRGEKQYLSAQYTLYHTLLTCLKLFAPIMPHITEELYQLYYKSNEKDVSIHVSSWPSVDEKAINEQSEALGELVVYAVTQSRRVKSEANTSLKTPIKQMFLKAKVSQEEFLLVEEDIKASTQTENLIFETMDEESKLDYASEIELE